MAVLTARFEAGTNGNTIATGDTGNATAWDLISIGASAVLAYDTTHVYQTLAAKLSTPATARAVTMGWSTALGAVTDHFGRFYIYLTANPGATVQLVRCQSTNTLACALAITSAGKLGLIDSAGAAQALSTNAITLNAWVRVEFHFTHSATVGQLELKLFNSPDSTSETETLTTGGALNTLASANRILFGVGAAVANIGPFWMDNLVANQTFYPGPLQKTQALASSVSLTPSLAAAAAFARTLSASVTLTPTLAKAASFARTLTATVTVTPTLVKQVAKTLASSVTLTPTIVKSVAKTVSGSVTLSPTISRSIGKTLTVSVSLTASIQKTISKTLSASVSLVASLVADFISGGGVVTVVADHAAGMVRRVRLLAEDEEAIIVALAVAARRRWRRFGGR